MQKISNRFMVHVPNPDAPRSAEDAQFDLFIAELQQIVIDPAFEKVLTQFMAQHWAAMDQQVKEK